MKFLSRSCCVSLFMILAIAASSTVPTHTIPVVNIVTEDSVDIVDKVTNIPAVMDITVPEGYTTLNGNKAENVNNIELTIRGRGNASWKLDKKPYKLKFKSKTSILGMSKSKHFALIAYPGGYVGGVAGMELARCTGQSWAPYSEPVEVILNGNYIGRYFIVESIKIDKNRLDIAEQPDLNEDESILDGGWLVEIDNYDNEAQIVIPEIGYLKLRVTHHTPEVLSEIQREWLTNQFTAMNDAIYSDDYTGLGWASMIDPTSVARYFIVRELLGDTDGFNGSFYLHKDLGEGKKWTFGPMWDLAMDKKNDWIFNDHPSYSAVHWIEAIFNTEIFKVALNEQWENIKLNIESVYDYIDRLGELCKEADVANYERWPQYEKGNSTEHAERAKRIIKHNLDWIEAAINRTTSVVGIDTQSEYQPVRIEKNTCRISHFYGNVHVDIFSIDGKRVIDKNCSGGETIDLSNLGKGVFMLRASDSSSNSVLKKIVVH